MLGMKAARRDEAMAAFWKACDVVESANRKA
jgi:hypothetical protein